MLSAGVVASGDAGGDLAAAAVAAMSSTGFVRAAADAVELEAVATLVRVRRVQAVAAARAAAREVDAARGLVPGTTRTRRVDVERVDQLTAQEVSVALTLSPVLARARVELAVELVHRRPATFAALQRGEVDLVRARRICDAVRALPAGTDPIPDGSDGHDDSDSPDSPDSPDSREPGDVAGAVEAEVLRPGSVGVLADLRPARPAGQLTPAQLGARLARLVLRADPAGAADRTAVADERRGCALRMLPEGMALLSVTGRAELLGAAFTRLDTTARQLLRADTRATSTAPDAAAATTASGAPTGASAVSAAGGVVDAARTLDQTRVDVFLATVLGDSEDLARAHNVTVELALLAPAGTVLAGGNEPGDLDGHGPIPAPLVRALAADARWRRFDTDPTTGHITGITGITGSRTGCGCGGGTGCGCGCGSGGCGADGHRHHTYRPSAAVAALVRARDQTCRFPTCRRRARACDLDHVTPFPHGPTCPTNLATECRLHHTSKHQGGFSLTITPDGTTTWTTPTGQHLTTHPPSWGRPPPDDADQTDVGRRHVGDADHGEVRPTAGPARECDPPPF